MAMACRVKQAGHRAGVCELPAFRKNLEGLRDEGSITALGMISGGFPLEFASTDFQECLPWADVVIVVTHAAAHDVVAGYCARYLVDSKMVILCPGYVGGGWHFNRKIAEAAPGLDLGVVECSVLPFACRKQGDRSVSIHGIKRRFMVSTCGGRFSEEALGLLDDLFTGMIRSSHPLEAGLNETNFILHAVIAMLNMGHVQGSEPWTFYRQGLTEAVGRVVESVDAERLSLLKEMELRPIPLSRWLLDFYGDQGMEGETIYDVMSSFPPFAKSPGPRSLSHRYFSEDIPFGLVPMSHLGQKFGVKMPLTNALIDLAGCVCKGKFEIRGRDLSHFS